MLLVTRTQQKLMHLTKKSDIMSNLGAEHAFLAIACVRVLHHCCLLMVAVLVHCDQQLVAAKWGACLAFKIFGRLFTQMRELF